MKEIKWDNFSSAENKLKHVMMVTQWLSGVSSSFSVSPAVVHNCCRKCLLKWWTFAFVDIWEEMEAYRG